MTLARASTQLDFPDVLETVRPRYPLEKPGQGRNVYGTIMADLACKALLLKPIPIDGTKSVCWDAERDGVFWEIKSVRKGGKVVLYDFRIAKELASGVTAYYCLVEHTCKAAKTSDEVWEMCSRNGLTLTVVDLNTVARISKTFPLQKIKSAEKYGVRCGYTRKGYSDGYRNVPLRALTDSRQGYEVEFCAYGLPFRVMICR